MAAKPIPPPREVTNHGRTCWLVDLRSLGSGRLFFDSAEAANRYQKDVLKDQEQLGRIAFDLPHETRLRYVRLERRLLELGASLEDAVGWYERTHKPATRKPIGEAIDECLAAKAAAGGRRRAVQQLGYSLHSFCDSVGPDTLCRDVTLDQVEDWLDNPDWGLRTRKNRLIDMRTFCAFAKRRGWMAADPSANVERIAVDETPPGILTVDQCRRLLNATLEKRPTFLPFIALGLFAGVRPEEIKQLSWREVNLETGYCEIPAHIAKRVRGRGSRQRRMIQLQPNALAWLKLGGDLPPIGWQDQFDAVRRAAGFAANARGRKRTKGQLWPKNAMRHSFCTYALPIFGEIDESRWAGHSPDIAHARYDGKATKEEAARFWTILPP